MRVSCPAPLLCGPAPHHEAPHRVDPGCIAGREHHGLDAALHDGRSCDLVSAAQDLPLVDRGVDRAVRPEPGCALPEPFQLTLRKSVRDALQRGALHWNSQPHPERRVLDGALGRDPIGCAVALAEGGLDAAEAGAVQAGDWNRELVRLPLVAGVHQPLDDQLPLFGVEAHLGSGSGFDLGKDRCREVGVEVSRSHDLGAAMFGGEVGGLHPHRGRDARLGRGHEGLDAEALGDSDHVHGSYYGDAWSDLEDFERTLKLVREIPARHYATFHHIGVIDDHERFVERIDRFAAVIRSRESRLLEYLTEPRSLDEIAEHLLARNAQGIFAALDEAITAGVDIGRLIDQLVGYFRDVMAAHVGCGSDLLLHCHPDKLDSLVEMGKRLGIEKILAAIQILDQALTRMRQSTQTRTLAEIALVLRSLPHARAKEQRGGMQVMQGGPEVTI